MNICDGILPIISDSNQTSNIDMEHFSMTEDKATKPSNSLGIAIIECMDKCNIGLVRLSELLASESMAINADKKIPFPLINIPPTTLHSYTLSQSTREIRKYALTDVLEVIAIIMDAYNTGHPKWTDKLKVKSDVNHWLSYPGITPKYINSVTGLTEQIIGRYSKGLYDVNYEKWVEIQTKMNADIMLNHETKI